MSARKLFQLFSIISLFLAPLSAWIFSSSGTSQFVVPFFFIFFSFYCVWFSRNELQAFGFLVILLPITYKFNYFKINLGNMLQFLGVSDFSVNFSFLLYLVIFFIFLVELIFNFRVFLKNPLLFPFLGLIFWTFASIFFSRYPSLSLGQFVIFSLPFICALLGFYFSAKKPQNFAKIPVFILVSAFFPLLIAFFQLLSGNFFYEPDSGLGRIYGSFSHPNPFGLFLFFTISLSLILFFSTKEKSFKKILFPFILISSIFLILTFSRTAWISLAFFLLVISFFLSRKTFNLVISSIIIVFVVLLANPLTQDRIISTFERTPFDSLYARENILKMSWQKIQQKPVLGYGVGTFEEIIRDVKESSEGSARAHNDVSLVFLELGVIGLFLLSLSLITFLVSFLRSKKVFEKNFSLQILKKEFTFDSEIFGKGLLSLFLTVFLLTSLAEAIFLKTIFVTCLFLLLGGWLGKKKVNKKTTA